MPDRTGPLKKKKVEADQILEKRKCAIKTEPNEGA